MNTYLLKHNEKLLLKGKYVIGIGFFDGLHLGHQALVKETVKISKETNLIPAIMTFDHYPLSVIKGVSETYLLSKKERNFLLEKMGIETIFEIEFTEVVSRLNPEDFIREYIIANQIKHVVAGYDFHFGYKNSGDIDTLKNDMFSLSIIAPVLYNQHQKISSTLIRNVLKNGKIEEASYLLGRPYSIRGKVIHGKHRGTVLGFPTANINIDKYLIPQRGVYGVVLEMDHKAYYGMANIGVNPTFNDLLSDSLEVYIFDFDKNIYNKIVKVNFLFFTRPEMTFKSLDDLIKKMQQDKEEISEKLKNSLTNTYKLL
ncbi:riboflavin biosynthesis protein RibF [Eggerthia catenaformis]